MPQNIWPMVVTFRIPALSNQLAHIVDIITYIICWGKSGKKVKHTEQRSHAEKVRHCMELFDDTLWGNSNSNRLSFALLCASIRGTRSSPWRVTLSALSPVDLMTAEPRVSMQQWTLCFFFSFLLAFHCIYIYIMVMALFLCFNCIVLCFPSPLISLNPRFVSVCVCGQARKDWGVCSSWTRLGLETSSGLPRSHSPRRGSQSPPMTGPTSRNTPLLTGRQALSLLPILVSCSFHCHLRFCMFSQYFLLLIVSLFA